MNNIVPTDFTTVVQITSFALEIVKWVANTSVHVRVMEYSGERVVKIDYVMLEGQAYADWGNDDTYLIQYVATALGFTLSS